MGLDIICYKKTVLKSSNGKKVFETFFRLDSYRTDVDLLNYLWLIDAHQR